jgi:hypothetical protein
MPKPRKPAAAPVLPKSEIRFDTIGHGLAREAELRQGVYNAGQQPTLYDPAYTRQRVPEAVLRHEEIHQNLTLQTSHGVLALILTAFNRVANARASLAACESTQWLVQELGATYGELAFVQRTAPSDFIGCIEALPSAARGGAAYREAFNFANWLLPLNDEARRERSDPRTLVIGALCSCSMSTACLRELASSDFDDARFASWIASNSPRERLEQIGLAAGPASFLALARKTGERFSQRRPTPEAVRQLFDELSNQMLALCPGLNAEPLSELETQAQAAVNRLRRACPEFEFDVAEWLRPQGALFTESPDKRKLLEQQYTFDDPQQVIEEWLEACRHAGGLHIITGLPDPGMAPAIAFVCIPNSYNPIPDDLRVRLRPDQFFECVKRFRGFPNVITMIGEGWPYWDAYLASLPQSHWAVRRVRDAIRITAHKSLSRERFALLLAHDELYDGARFIHLGLEAGGSVVLFDNPKVNAVYAIQQIDSELALAELRKLLAAFKVTPIKEPGGIVNFELLYWIIQRESSARLDPG